MSEGKESFVNSDELSGSSLETEHASIEKGERNSESYLQRPEALLGVLDEEEKKLDLIVDSLTPEEHEDVELQQRITEVVNGAKEHMRKVAYAGIFAASLLAPQSGHTQEGVTSGEFSAENGESYTGVVQKLEESVLKDDAERYLLFSARGNEGFQLGYEMKSQGTYVSSEDTDEAAVDRFFAQRDKEKNENKEVFIREMHTHPLTAFKSPDLGLFSEDDVEKMRRGEEGLHSMPASQVDVMGMIMQAKKFDNEHFKYSSAVVDPTGLWEYSPDPKHSFPVKMNQIFEDVERYGQELIERENDPDSFRKSIDHVASSGHPGTFLNRTLDPRLWTLADKMLEKYMQEFQEKLTLAEQKNFVSALETTPLKILSQGDEGERNVLIKRYIEEMSDIGIEAVYKGNNGTFIGEDKSVRNATGEEIRTDYGEKLSSEYGEVVIRNQGENLESD